MKRCFPKYQNDPGGCLIIMLFYKALETMTCLQGDTLPEFCVDTDIVEEKDKYTMCLILETTDSATAGGVALQRECSSKDIEEGTSYFVQLTSEDTKELSGSYLLHFRLTYTNDETGLQLQYRKICGTLTVRPVAQGV